MQVIPDRLELRIVAHAFQGGDQAFECGALRVGLKFQLGLNVFRLLLDLPSFEQDGRGVDAGHPT